MKHFLKFLSLVVGVGAFIHATGQSFSVSGTVIDEVSQPVSFANIGLFNNVDSVLVSGVKSDELGKFSIGVKPGKYFIRITFVSYEDKTISNITVVNNSIVLGQTILKQSSLMLTEVIVKEEKAQMELQVDKRVFNVQKDLASIGGNAQDILATLPSVEVAPDGTVSLRGSGNVRILINGQVSSLTSRDPASLRRLQGNLIERVEIITNPSSRYDAAGEAGIINIVLKKDEQQGFNGVFTGNAGTPGYLGGSYSLNYRGRKTNLFSSYGADYRKRLGYSNSSQNYTSADTSFIYDQASKQNSGELSHNLMLGLDYFLNETSSITGSFLFGFENGETKSLTNYTDLNATGQPIRFVHRAELETEAEKNIEGNLDYKKDFKAEGHELTANFKYIRSVDNERSDYLQEGAGSVLQQKGVNDANETNLILQTDYTRPFKMKGKVEAGLKSSTRFIENNFSLSQREDEQSNWTIYPAFSNNFLYTERIHAAYLMANRSFDKVSLQGGLREEYSDIITELTETNQINRRQYANLFPSANLSYELTDNNNLQFSFSSRISRPDFRDLLPFSNFSDSRVFFMGNPTLQPEYTKSYEVSYLKSWDNGSMLPSFYYRRKTNVTQSINEIDSLGITRITPVNLAVQNAYGFEFSLNHAVKKFLKLNTSANFYRAITDGTYKDERFYSDTYSWTARMTSKFTFFNDLNLQASFNYRSPRINPIGKSLAVFSIDLGASKDVLHGKGTVSVGVRDLLNSRINKTVISRDGYYSYAESQGQSRQISVTFTYRLKQINTGRGDDDEHDDEDDGDGGDE